MDRSFFSRQRIAGFLGLVALALCLAWLPSATHGVLGSPDETATFVAARQIALFGSARVPETLAPSVPWLHPRSWVSQGTNLVPVGFLGWPMLLSPVAWIAGGSLLPWMGGLLLLSSAFPLFILLRRRFGESGALWGTILFFSFPTVLLYGNRGLFANLPQLALVLWWAWLVLSARDRGLMSSGRRSFAIGLLGMIVLALRPVEGLWLFPWMCWWARPRSWSGKQGFWIVGGAAVVGVVLAIITLKTYGSIFAIGYLLRDNPLLDVSTQRQLASTQILVAPAIWTRLRDFFDFVLPYGLHPRNIWWNLRSFTTVFLWPWVLALIIVWIPSVVKMKQASSIRMSSTTKWMVGLSVWTAFIILSIYGSGLFTDHVRPGAVTIGNSFLRYLLPCVPLWVYAFLSGSVRVATTARARAALSALTLLLALVGCFQAFAKDDEGLLTTRHELVRYGQIRSEAQQMFPAGSVILSDRSDKIFFPVLRAVTPMPEVSERIRLIRAATMPGLGLFARPLSQSERDTWRQAGLEPQVLKEFGREQLYRLVPIQR